MQHGGQATGPRTEDGKQKVALNLPCVRLARSTKANPEPRDPNSKLYTAAEKLLARRQVGCHDSSDRTAEASNVDHLPLSVESEPIDQTLSGGNQPFG